MAQKERHLRMQNDLILYASGDVTPQRGNRQVAARAKQTYDETRLAGFKVDAVMALGAHIMDGSAQLVAHGQALAGGNPQLGAVMSTIAADTIRQAQTIQRQAFNRFGI
jgi:hypothetical protein